jgi:hypothetical protein
LMGVNTAWTVATNARHLHHCYLLNTYTLSMLWSFPFLSVLLFNVPVRFLCCVVLFCVVLCLPVPVP